MDRKILGIARRIWFHVLAGSVSLFIVVPLTVMILDREDPVRIHSNKLTGEFFPGGRLTLAWHATAVRLCDGEVRARIVDSKGIVFEYEPTFSVIRSSKGETRTYQIEFALPASMALGEAYSQAHISYYCNPLHRWLHWPIRVVRDYPPFEVKAKPNG